MPHVTVGGAGLYYEESGTGEPVVFVHGNWTEHSTWRLTTPELAPGMRTIAYDRRGSGRSQRTRDRLTRRMHEDDLASVIEALGAAPAHVVGNSYGASVALGLAARRPELFRSLTAHEPPLVAIAGEDPAARAELEQTRASFAAVVEQVEACDVAGAAQRFVEEVALGPGGWATLPEPIQEIMISNATVTAEEMRDPALGSVDLDALARIDVPILITKGDRSPAWFHGIVDRLGDALADARLVTIAGAGHNPHVTHPGELAAMVAEHARAEEAVR
jgi:pimeloyl-ACP methyl ester carboxylesterase